MSPSFNSVLQFVPEKVVSHDGKLYALAGGAWLVGTSPFLSEGCLPAALFRDYWEVACYDDSCPMSVRLHASPVVGLVIG